jgi:hypothetical protein
LLDLEKIPAMPGDEAGDAGEESHTIGTGEAEDERGHGDERVRASDHSIRSDNSIIRFNRPIAQSIYRFCDWAIELSD